MQTSGHDVGNRNWSRFNAQKISSLAAGRIRDALSLNEADSCLNPMPFASRPRLISASISSLLSGVRG